jgi:hypoxanthine phosphoribosyltransferase
VTDQPRFAHASEAELARILDYYGLRWEYEPRTFPIMWNLDGKVVESFSPDFYLPEIETYVELTTLKQSLVRRKNRKLRRLRELYPDIRVKLFYGKDFRALMLKYGRFDLAASLSGLEGQIVPARSATGPTLAVAMPAAMPAASPAATTGPTETDGTIANAAAPVAASARRRISRGSRRRRGRRAYIDAAQS